jgi:hypothetical protein
MTKAFHQRGRPGRSQTFGWAMTAGELKHAEDNMLLLLGCKNAMGSTSDCAAQSPVSPSMNA